VEHAIHRTESLRSATSLAAAACDRVLVLDDGRLVQQGRHQELLLKPGHLPPPLGAAEGREQLQVPDRTQDLTSVPRSGNQIGPQP